MAESPTLSSTLEDYLEAIVRLLSEKRAARVRDIAEAVQVHKSSVSVALKRLAEKGLVEYEPYELVSLTPEGEELGREIYRRHKVIRRFLTEVLSVDEEVAEANACRIEHAIDSEVLDRLLQFLEFEQRCPRAGLDFLRGFGYYCTQGEEPGVQCEHCMERALEEFRRKRDAAGSDAVPTGES